MLITSYQYYLSEKLAISKFTAVASGMEFVMPATHKGIIVAACLKDEKDGAMYAIPYVAEYYNF